MAVAGPPSRADGENIFDDLNRHRRCYDADRGKNRRNIIKRKEAEIIMMAMRCRCNAMQRRRERPMVEGKKHGCADW